MSNHSGGGTCSPELDRMSKQGQWSDMIALVTDDMLDAIGVAARPAEVGRCLRQRNAWADRTSLLLYNETAPPVVADLVRAFKEPDQ
jgi:hypothetical protein